MTFAASFGHELMFSRTLELEMDQSNSFEMVKVAADGTQIFKYWFVSHSSHTIITFTCFFRSY